MNEKKDNSFKIRWKTSKEKQLIMSSIISVKGELSINEWIKKLIIKEIKSTNTKDYESSNDKLDRLLVLTNNNNSLARVTEVELRTLFWFVINKLDINLEKGFQQLDLDGKHSIPKEILDKI